MTSGSSNSSGSAAEKAREIRHVLQQPLVDLWRLRELALSEGGLVNGTWMYVWMKGYGIAWALGNELTHVYIIHMYMYIINV
jgi:hypothetical protein